MDNLRRAILLFSAVVLVAVAILGFVLALDYYNASESDIEAVNVKVLIPETEGVYAHWDCDKDICPSLKKHAKFDIHITLCSSAPNFIPITIEWKQRKKFFSTIESIQLH